MPARPPLPRRRFVAATATSALVASGLAVVALAPPAQATTEPTPECSATSCAATYAYTGSTATFTVPADVTSVTAIVAGAAGGGVYGGLGGSTRATLAVSPGDTFTVLAGQQGVYGTESASRTFGGGGATDPVAARIAGSGGGGSFVFDADGGLLLAAGGGGGAQANGGGAARGGGNGSGARTASSDGVGGDGSGGPVNGYTHDVPKGGSQTAGGQGGLATRTDGSETFNPGSNGGGPAGNGKAGPGGDGAFGGRSATGNGGGGGGGYYGGGGGSWIEGGGGGSGFAASTVTKVDAFTGANSAAGSVRFVWSITQDSTTTLAVTPASGVPGQGDTVTLTATVAAKTGTPTGTVAFTDGGKTVIGCGNVALANGSATCTTALAAGDHKLKVAYSGGTGYAASASAEQTYTVANRPRLNKVFVPSATVGAPYSRTLEVSGGTKPYTFAISDGLLPAGLDLDGETGTIGGTPTAATTSAASFTVTVTDDNGETGSRTYLLSVNKASQTVSFTFEPTTPTVGDIYFIPASAKGPGSAPLVLTGNDNCTVSGTMVTFDHAGTCTVTANQDGDDNYDAAPAVEHSATVDRADQALTVTSDPPATSTVGDTHALTVTGGPSSATVSIGLSDSTTNSACSLGTVTTSVDGGVQKAATTISYDRIGTCWVVVSQGGDDDHTGAANVFIPSEVKGKATTTSLALSANPAVHGQPVTATATVTGATAGSVEFVVDGKVRPAVDLTGAGTATSGDLGSTFGKHTVEARFTPTDTDTYAGSTSGETTLSIGPASSTTTIKVTPTSLVATVSVDAPSTDTPTGSVSFAVGGTTVGSADLVDGVATLTYRVPAGAARTVSATYSGRQDADGNTEVGTSSDSTVRRDPVITAKATAAVAVSRFGWYRTPVTISFTCTAGSAALTTPCPAPVTAINSGTHSATRTVRTADGGVATAGLTVKLDRSPPVVRITGPVAGRTYPGALPAARCVATDTVSGVASCTVVRTGKGTSVTWTATATDRAGNIARATVTARRTTTAR